MGVFDTRMIAFGLQLLFEAPNTDDPLNKEAAALMDRDERQFQRTVRDWLQRGEQNQLPPTHRF
eukprot:NODE_6824_length_274_cov_140.786667_g6212_i0.p1 GENE.NODE_6824_length_274_cov_140.786667_g6212_i0~~NODE_6824_length_274_cov_140.786667_g6212_i0.p1  ORF type:complete len:64 (-),score=12.54 NODE_6824_length_274_cov_140.786667_g6212_i0:51-242(-)